VALAVIMVPIVARSTEEIVRLVPTSVREAALALGIPVWKTVLRVIVRTALAGILATVMLAVARVAGETAPLILTAVGNQAANVGDVLSPMDSLPTFIWYASGQPNDLLVGQAWGAALILMLFVLTANLLVRGRTAGRRRSL
jgi:phosphate transport system permease protein